MKQKIMFITTYHARDFEGHSLIAWYANNKTGIKSVFVSGYGVIAKILKEKPSLLVIDHLVWDHKKFLVRQVIEMGIKVVQLPTEGYFKSPTDLDKIIGYPEIQNLGLDKYLLWNNSMYDRAKDLVTKSYLERFRITGNPRFDFYLNPALKTIIEPEKDFRKRFNIPLGSHIFTYMSTSPYQGYSFKKFHDRYRYNAKYPLEKIQALHENQQRLFNNHSSIIARLAKENPNDTFFYKTHPSERYIKRYEPIFAGIPNLILISNENVRPFLMHSDLILQRNCTTALEAWLMGKPVLQVDDDENYISENYEEHKKYSYILKDFNAINSFIKARDYEKWSNKDVNEFLEQRFYTLDGNAYKRVGDQILSILRSQTEEQLSEIEKNIELKRIQINDTPRNKLKALLGLKPSTHLNPTYYLKKILPRESSNTNNERDIEHHEVEEVFKKYELYLAPEKNQKIHE